MRYDYVIGLGKHKLVIEFEENSHDFQVYYLILALLDFAGATTNVILTEKNKENKQ